MRKKNRLKSLLILLKLKIILKVKQVERNGCHFFIFSKTFSFFKQFFFMIGKEGNFIVIKFTEGEIIQNLKSLAKEKGISSAIILNGIGMLENAVIGYFNGEKYIEKRIEEPAELVSLQGNIGKDNGEFIIHAHASLACKDHMLIGGHLLKGNVKVVNEIVLYVLDKIKIKRIRKGNLMEMQL